MRLATLLSVMSLFCFSGCAAVFNDTTETVYINSNPPGAAVSVDGVPLGNTPLAAELTNDIPHQVQVSSPGYQTIGAVIGSSLGAGWLVLDIFLGGIVGIIVDAVTDAWQELDTDSLFFNLVPALGKEAPESDAGAVPVS